MIRTMCLVVVFILLLLAPPAFGDTIWSDSFENGLWQWDVTGSNWDVIYSTLSAHSGYWGTDVRGGTDPDDD